MDGWTNEKMEEWMDRRMNGWVEDRWMDGWMGEG